MDKLTFVAYMVDENGATKDFYKYTCKKVSAVENDIRKAMAVGNTGLMSLFRSRWIANGVVACEIYKIYRTPDGVYKEKAASRIVMDWAFDEPLKTYYKQMHPDDADWNWIKEGSTFRGLLDALNREEDVYGYIGVRDSMIRAALFNRLAKIMGVEYGVLYDKWLGSIMNKM